MFVLRLIGSRARLLLTVALFALFPLGGDPSLKVHCQGQAGCVNTTSEVTNPATLEPLLDTTAVCQGDFGLLESSSLADGTFVKSGVANNVRQGARAAVTGKCHQKAWSNNECLTTTWIRNIVYVWLRQEPGPVSNSPLGNIGPNGSTVFKQTIDSSIAGSTNGPVTRNVSTPATYAFKFWVQSEATPCQIQLMIHPQQTRTIHSTPCKPEWFFHNGVNLRAPLTDITINVPLGFDEALIPARDAARDVEAATGIHITVNYNTPCVGGACVTFSDTHVSDPTKPSCASLQHGTYSPSGVLNGPSTIRLMANVFRTAHPQQLQRTIAHELLHYFGLENRETSGCTATNTILGAGPCYDTNAPPPTEPLGPTSTDAAAVKTGTYGPQNRKICGW